MQNKENQKREKILKKIQEFCLLDDDFMTKCFEDNIECTELVLRIIMDKALGHKVIIQQTKLLNLFQNLISLLIFFILQI